MGRYKKSKKSCNSQPSYKKPKDRNFVQEMNLRLQQQLELELQLETDRQNRMKYQQQFRKEHIEYESKKKPEVTETIITAMPGESLEELLARGVKLQEEQGQLVNLAQCYFTI